MTNQDIHVTDDSSPSRGRPSEEELAAAMAAVRLMLRRRRGQPAGRSRWLRFGRFESTGSPPGPATWRTAERPR